MSMQSRQQLRNIMLLAWQFSKRNGYKMDEAFNVAWLNFKLRKAMTSRIVKFYYQKVDGTPREAYGTLRSDIIPNTGHENSRPQNPTVQVYYDTEVRGWRCFKRANLIRIVRGLE